MVNFTPSQNRMVAAGLSVLSFAVVLAFVLFVGWTVLSFLEFASSAIIPVVLGLFLSMLFKPYYMWFLARLKNPTLPFTGTPNQLLVTFTDIETGEVLPGSVVEPPTSSELAVSVFALAVSTLAVPITRHTCCSLSFMKHSAGCFVQQPKQPWQAAYFPSARITRSHRAAMSSS